MPKQAHRPINAKKDPMKQYKGAVSRAQGKHFEEYIDLSLRYYEQKGEAIVEKTPEGANAVIGALSPGLAALMPTATKQAKKKLYVLQQVRKRLVELVEKEHRHE